MVMQSRFQAPECDSGNRRHPLLKSWNVAQQYLAEEKAPARGAFSVRFLQIV